MKTSLILLLLVFCLSLCAIEDYEQIWILDNPSQLQFIVNSDQTTQYHTHALVNGTLYIQNQECVQWLYGWHLGDMQVPGYVGFSRTYPELLVNPVFAAMPPQIFATNLLTDDPINDNLYNTSLLDIMEYRMSYTADRLYFAIRTVNPSYVTSSGMTYYAYMPAIVDPSAGIEDDPIVYGLMYTVDMAPIISPGLYKISGSGLDGLTRLGDIEYNIQEDYLLLSCQIADLLGDPDFASWYDPQYPLFATTATTSRITLVNGIQQSDMSEGVKVLLKPHYVEMINESSPVLSNSTLNMSENTIQVSIDYFDADANVPHLATVRIDDHEAHTLLPQSTGDLDFGSVVTYAQSWELESPDWELLTFSFSDSNILIQSSITNPSSSGDDPSQAITPILELYPNPATATLKLRQSNNSIRKLAVYNIKGQQVAGIELNSKEAELDLSGFATGIYIIRTPGLPNMRFLKL